MPHSGGMDDSYVPLPSEPVAVEVTPHQLRVIGARACCDPRTVRRRLEGRPVRSTTCARIDEVLRDLGLIGPARPSAGEEDDRD